MKRIKYERDDNGNFLEPKELLIKVDYFNGIIYVKNNSEVSPIEYYVLLSETGNIDIYDVTYKTVERKNYTSFEYAYLTLLESYCDKYNLSFSSSILYNELHTNDNCKIYSDDFIDFDVIHNGNTMTETWKIDNNLVTYCCFEYLNEKATLYKEEVYLDYSRSIIKPSLEGYQKGGN